MPSAARHPRGWGRREGGVAPPTRRFWTFGLQNRERIHFACCKPPVCGSLFPPPREAPFFLHVALRGARPSHGLAGRRAVGPQGWDGGVRFCRMMTQYHVSRCDLGFLVVQPIAPFTDTPGLGAEEGRRDQTPRPNSRKHKWPLGQSPRQLLPRLG